MPNDKFGRPIKVGDEVVIKGTVETVTEDPNYINCTVKLDEPMPPSGAEVRVQVNTAQLEDETPGPAGETKPAANEMRKPPFESKPLQHEGKPHEKK